MKILDLKNFVNERVPFTYYPNAFPTSTGAPDYCAMIALNGGFPTDELGKTQPGFQVKVRAAQYADADCESKAYEIFDSLTNLENVQIGADSVVAIRSTNSVPYFIGKDDLGRPIYSMNFATVVRPR